MTYDRERSGRHFILVPVDGFSLLSVASVIDPLRSANRALGAATYSFEIATVTGEPVTASSGIVFPATTTLAAAPRSDLTIVCAGLVKEPPQSKEMAHILRRRAREGEPLGGVSTGPWLLGLAGLLDGYRCTIHWESRAAFVDKCPKADVTEAPYEIDRNRFTSSGGTASIDMVLQIIKNDHGADVSREVANQFQHERIRSNADRQRPAHEPDLTGKPESVARVIQLMADNLEEPLSSQALADAVQLSVRQVERLFERYVSATPTNYYISLRLRRARELLRQTDASVLDVCLATGFSSQSHFAHSYRAAFGMNPSDERRIGTNFKVRR
ncbi:MAG: GlxA family transcriptional regulator [Devosia sp.]